ncbi:hypothetical protein [Streptomyces sp. NRRL B-3229]|uniref:hypothetical protein n=1 Tax=Streptomyces sp. NRRL B-3229 TaxID=1463836 RepID=UPI0004C09A17|nr:hypothetical protein [Streptomyces sp. NRRL B-3229]
MTRTHAGHLVAMLAIATLAALPASVTAAGRPAGSTVTTTVVEAKADGPGPCCKSVEQAFPRG